MSVEGESNFDRDFGEEYQINGTIAKELTPSFGIAATLQYRNTDRLNYDVSILDPSRRCCAKATLRSSSCRRVSNFPSIPVSTSNW